MGGQRYAAKIFDTAGQEKYSCALPGSFYRKSHCCILVYDVTNPRSFQSLDKWKNEFVTHTDVRNSSAIPFILVGNKSDDASDRRVSLSFAFSHTPPLLTNLPPSGVGGECQAVVSNQQQLSLLRDFGERLFQR